MVPPGPPVWPSLGKCQVILVLDRLEPLVRSILCRYGKRDVLEPGILCCAMPVLDLGRNAHDIAGRKPARRLAPGDVVSIAPEVKHWHGATKDSWFQHIALAVPAQDATNEWLEPVEDKDYLALA